MELIYLSNIEKEILLSLNQKDYGIGDLPQLTKEELSASIDYLMEKGLVSASFLTGHVVHRARILDKGKVYIKWNPELKNPVSKDDIDKLTAENLVLQNDELKHKETIRKQESIIRMWQVISAILGLLSVILAIFK